MENNSNKYIEVIVESYSTTASGAVFNYTNRAHLFSKAFAPSSEYPRSFSNSTQERFNALETTRVSTGCFI